MEEARKGRQTPTLNDLSKMVYHSTNTPYNFNIIKA